MKCFEDVTVATKANALLNDDDYTIKCLQLTTDVHLKNASMIQVEL